MHFFHFPVAFGHKARKSPKVTLSGESLTFVPLGADTVQTIVFWFARNRSAQRQSPCQIVSFTCFRFSVFQIKVVAVHTLDIYTLCRKEKIKKIIYRLLHKNLGQFNSISLDFLRKPSITQSKRRDQVELCGPNPTHCCCEFISQADAGQCQIS